MPTELTLFDAVGPRVAIRRPLTGDCSEFVALVKNSLDFLRPWVEPTSNREGFYAYLRRLQSPTDDGFFICELETGQIAGVVNVSVIVRGLFQSAFLGYWIGAPFARRGYMVEGLHLLTRYAFTEMGLHRLEANIQPDNLPSIATARRAGLFERGIFAEILEDCRAMAGPRTMGDRSPRA